MFSLFVLIKKEILELFKTNKFIILSFIFLFVAVASPITAKLLPLILKSIDTNGITINLPDPSYLDSLDQFIKNISQIAIFAIVLIVSGAIADEKSHKTLEMILTKPISRDLFILAKFKAYFLTIFSIFIISSGIFYTYTVSLFGSFSFVNFSIIVGCVLLYILMVIGITLLMSTLMKNNLVAAILSFIFMILINTGMGLINSLKGYVPNQIFGMYRDIINNGFNNDLIKPILVSLIIIVLSLLLSILSFRNQEIER